MGIIDIESLEGNDDVHVYASLTESQLRNRLNPDNALFIAESPKVIKVALQAGYDPVSILCERKHIEGDAAEVIAMAGDIDVFTGSRELLQSLTGYRLTRGVLCAMRRPALPSVDAVAANASRIVVIDGVTDTTNIGAIFRSAAALGIDAVLLTPTSCDPLNRRAVRVSMGSVFLVPWTFIYDPISSLKRLGFVTAAMALNDDSVSLDEPALKKRTSARHNNGNRGRWAFRQSDQRCRLYCTDSDGSRSGFTQCGRRSRSGFLGTSAFCTMINALYKPC